MIYGFHYQLQRKVHIYTVGDASFAEIAHFALYIQPTLISSATTLVTGLSDKWTNGHRSKLMTDIALNVPDRCLNAEL